MEGTVEYIESVDLGKSRVRKIFSFFPLTIVLSDKIYLVQTGVWFKHIMIQEKKIKWRYSKFDEFCGDFFWSEWMYDWKFDKVIKDDE